MKKTILTTIVAATLSISSVCFAGNIETAERYSAQSEKQQIKTLFKGPVIIIIKI
jgi:hypothetical protein